MPQKSQRPPSPITAAVPSFDASALLAASLPPALPDYDKNVEITVDDFCKRPEAPCSNSAARKWLYAEVKDGRWSERQVKLPTGKVAAAFRPVPK